MEIPTNVKIGFAGALLFGAIAVDFASKFMSVAFDLFFIAAAIFFIFPVLKDKKKE